MIGREVRGAAGPGGDDGQGADRCKRSSENKGWGGQGSGGSMRGGGWAPLRNVLKIRKEDV